MWSNCRRSLIDCDGTFARFAHGLGFGNGIFEVEGRGLAHIFPESRGCVHCVSTAFGVHGSIGFTLSLLYLFIYLVFTMTV